MWYGYETGLSPVMSYEHSFRSSHKSWIESLFSSINSLAEPAESEGFAHKQLPDTNRSSLWAAVPSDSARPG